MGLAETQKFLARLYTSAALRERFSADPLQVGKEFGLSADEAQQLGQTSARALDFFADTLLSKRLREVVKLMPLTHAELRQNFASYFKQYAAETPIPEGGKKHLEDALAFAEYLQNFRQDEQDWLMDLIRYEAGWLKASKPEVRRVIRFFRYQVDKSLRPLPVGRSLAVWVRIFSRSRLRHYILSQPSVRKNL